MFIGEILEWAAELEYWEQAALHKVFSGKPLVEDDYQELLTYLLEDADLLHPSTQRPALDFPKRSKEADQSPIRLVAISDLQNVNALVEKQTLTFSPDLTAVFGRNGSGKSGYARVLGCAGFTRGDRDVLPDVTRSDCDNLVLSAVIEVADGSAVRRIDYEVGAPCLELSSVYVFDSTSVRVHLNESNTFSFSPAGLAYLTDLARVTDQVRQRLGARIDECKQPLDFRDLFLGESWVTRCMEFVGPDTSLEALDQIATLSDTDIRRMKDLDREIASLKSKAIDEEVADIDQMLVDIEGLSSQLENSSNEFQDSVADDVREAIDTCRQLDSKARSLSVDRFRTEGLRCIGTEEWHVFIEAAKALAETEQEEGERYPAPDSKCLLCHQPLTNEARELILSLWEFVEGEVKSRYEEARQRLGDKIEHIRSLDLAYFDSATACHRTLNKLDAKLTERVAAFVDACKTRKRQLVELADSQGAQAELSSMPSAGVRQDLKAVIQRLKKSRDDLAEIRISERIRHLEQDLFSLQHRQVVAQNLEQIKEYVQKQRWAREAARVGGSTRHITKKYKNVFKRLVTNRYLELFGGLLQELERPLNVKVKTTGKKGETYKQIVLESVSPSTAVERATPDKVLSGGEKRAVALADFLTEVSLDTSSGAIVLDDPVTSLDLEWRDTISKMLVAEAKRRQVIVFTHDLPFLYYLKRDAQVEQIELATHWVKRGELNDKPGYVFPDNSPALEKEYRSTERAHELYKLAKDALPARQESLLREGFGALRSTYEAFIVFSLFGGVVNRFEERISFLRLEKVVWDRTIIREVIDRCGHLSRYIEAHLHSDTFVQKPSCSDLLKEIEDFQALKRRHKELVKAIS